MENPHHIANYWAMWWGISIGLTFLAAATISFALGQPLQKENALSNEPICFYVS